MRYFKLKLIGSAFLVTPGLLLGQRQPVLQQIKVPHSYYYREMYLPQLTSGPSSVTWSPDGRELIYSMQGSLWRQRVGSREARQLTADSSYDYQPDWSPDGREVVYASYKDDAVELRLLDLGTGRSRRLISNGAVNVEPRWSPDGARIAYVSTAYEGRWHIFLATAHSEDAGGTTQRITEDHASGLPRYYYAAYDQYLSPTWSPEGTELILVSNRGHIWGSGGFWRMPVQPGGQLRELHYEETTWKARPDWSRDGKRIVYSSYLGAQWNQLWVMTADGGDPFQLTYGSGDATAPRWSPDGTRIAYISNAGGNPALEIVTVPGGNIERVVSPVRHYLRSMGRIRLSVVDQASGRTIPARVSITAAGRSYGPDSAWLHADDSFDRHERPTEYGYYHADPATGTVVVPAGETEIEVSRGPEYRVDRRTIQVSAGSTVPVRVPLERMVDLPASGWFSGDLHVHMNYGGSYRNTPAGLAAQARAEDLHLVENLIVNKEGRIPDLAWFTGRPDPVSSATTLIVHDQEYHTSYWGHIGLLGLRRNILLPAYAAYVNTAAASLFPTNADIMDLAHQQGGVTGYVHPFDSYPDPGDSTKPLTDELPVDAALGKVDYYEALGFVDDYTATARVWYQLLNCGFRLPAGAGTDAMANFASLRGPVGMNRVYVRSGSLDRSRFLAALKAGRSFATNGPLLGFTLNGKGLGEELKLAEGTRQVRAQVRLDSYVPVDHLEIVRNGKVVKEVPVPRGKARVSTSLLLPVEGSGWYLLRARADKAEYPVLDVYPYATTSPIYVTVGGRLVRSAEDAKYFVSWIDRLRQGALTHPDWNSDAEKAHTLDLIDRARQEFVRRAAP
jgi:TolB protein